MADIEDRTRRRLIRSITPDCEQNDEQIHALIAASEPVTEQLETDSEEEGGSRT